MTAIEAYLRLYSYPIVKMSHTIYSLPIHEPDGQNIIIDEDEETEESAAVKMDRDSQLLAFFKLCGKKDDNGEQARKMTYDEIPYKFTYNLYNKYLFL